MIKAVLTGHSRGLGGAIAEALLAQGVRVLALARSDDGGLAARYPQCLQEVQLDLSDTGAVAAWLTRGLLTRFLADADRALLINNAGLLQPVGPAGTQGASAIAGAVAVNVTAPLMLTDAFIAATAACPDRRVLHVSSGAARTAYAGWSVYCATKAALDHHARAVALDGVPGLRIASLAPGVIDTDMQAQVRASSLAAFPSRPRFEALKSDGALASPAEAAQRLVDYLQGEGYGAVVDADLRHLPPSAATAP